MSGVSAEDIATIKASGLFDEAWYLDQYPDVKKLGMDPVEHYLWVGYLLERNPSIKFDTAAYLDMNKDVAEAGVNPLLHYARWGKAEDRPTLIVVDKHLAVARPTLAWGIRPVVVYESHNLKQQGAPNSLFEIAVGMSRRGNYQPLLFSNSAGPLMHQYQAQNIDTMIHGISANRVKDSATRQRHVRMLAEFYIKNKAALIHVNTLQNFHCILAADYAGIPAVWNIRESEDPDTYYDYLPADLRSIAYSCFAKASVVVFVAEATRKRWRSRLDSVVENLTILNGIDTTRIMKFVYGTNRAMLRAAFGLRETDVMFLNVGTVSERKGQRDLIEAIKRLDSETKRRLVLAIIGFNSTDYSRQVHAELEGLQQQGLRCYLLNESKCEEDRRRVAEFYLSADVFVLSSRVESYPRVTLEAMEFCLPIISTPCFGVREQLVEDQSALFYEQGDINTLCAHISLLCSNSQKRRDLGSAAHARLADLNSYNQMLEAYEAVYELVIARKRSWTSGSGCK